MRQGGVPECHAWRTNAVASVAAAQQSPVVEHGDRPTFGHSCHRRVQVMWALRGFHLFGADDGGRTTRCPLLVLHGHRVQLSHSRLLAVLRLGVV